MAAPARDRFVAQMRALVGTHEDRGPNKNKITKAFRMDGQPWCMMAVSYAAKQAGIPTTVVPWTASCAVLADFARHHGRIVPAASVQPGDILILELDGRTGTYDHVEVAIEAPSGGKVRTIGGNTRPDDVGRQGEGDGVYARRRALSLVRLAFRPDWAAADKRRVPVPVRVGLAVGAVVIGAGAARTATPSPVKPPATTRPAVTGTPTRAVTTVRPAPKPAATKPAAMPAVKSKPAAKPVTTARRTLAYGSRGDDVRALQRRLRVTVDGIYGRRTTRAVETWQRTHRLRVDGVVGPKTAASLGLR